ncbi:DDB1- and CUL4-associated factor 6-like [Amphiura filiformis]|uniref:DDB1- and CUL4-associated factor 6-like n=1 Tax=Amphiura filiformis TaxID=82378 RepID=UPI003B20D325
MNNRGFTPVIHRRQLGFLNERATRDTIVGSVDFVQRLKIDAKLDVHRGCVNTICWNDTGTYLLSGSDDKKLCITDPTTRKAVTSIQSGHRSNIFSARFLPVSKDHQIVSCSGDGIIAYNDVEREDMHGRFLFNCHYGTAYEVTTVPNDPYTFLSCGEDYTVRWFDLRTKSCCMKDDCKEDILINCHRAVTSLAVNPIVPYHLGVGCSDSSVRVFDRRMLGTRATGNYIGRGIQGMFSRFCPGHLQNKYSRPTSLHYSADGQDILVSYSTDYVYLFSPNSSGKEEKEFSTDIDGVDLRSPADKDEIPPVNPVKKLRLRGDWSDTGPKARPRGEQGEGETGEAERPRMTIIQRMSEMLTRWLEDTAHARRPTPNRSAESQTTDAPTTSSNESTTLATEGATASSVDADQLQGTSSAPAGGASKDQVDESEESSGEKYVSAASELEPDDVSSDSASQQKGARSKKIVKRVSLRRVSSSDSSDSDGRKEEKDSKKSGKGDEGDGSAKGASDFQGETDVQYDDKTNQVCVETKDSICNISNTADSSTKTKELDGSEDEDEESKKRKRSVNSSPSGSLTDDTASRTSLSQETEGEKVDKHVVKSLKVKEGGKDPDDPHSSSSDSDDKKTSAIDKPKLDNDGEQKEQKSDSSSKGDSSNNVQSNKQKENTGETDESNRDELSAGTDSGESRASSAQSVRSREQAEPCVSTDGSPVFALSQRKEDSNPQERRTSQFKVPIGAARVRKMSVSGPPGTAPNEGFHPADDTAEARDRPSTSNEEAATGATGSSAEGAVGNSQDADREGAAGEETRGETQESPSITNSESDSDDDAILGPPRGFRRRDRERRQRGMSSEEPRERESPINVSAENRLRELLRARALRKEREKEEQQMQSVYSPRIKKVYKGHRNSRTMIKEANFWGNNFVLSGSDCGHVFIWDRHTSELVMLLEGDRHVVNCVQPHPFDAVLATSGIDYDIKLWAPLAEYPHYPDDADEVMRINELMLEETRDTITVPPSFMLRMLASINHLNAERRRQESHSSSEEES